MTLSISIATLLLLILTALPLWRNSHWLVRSMDFPRLQLAGFAIVLLLAQFKFIDAIEIKLTLLAFTLSCFVWQAWWILPYTRIWPKEVKSVVDTSNDPHDKSRLSIVTANVLGTNRQAEKLISLIREHKPDVLVTLESDLWWQDKLEVLEKDMPHTIKCPLDNLYGMHVYSRLPILKQSINFLVEKEVPSMHALIKLRNGHKVGFHFLHPAPPSPTENTKSEERDAELIMVARSITKNESGPIVATGDLNDVAWSPTTRLFRKLSGLLDPRIGRGMYNTYNADHLFLRWPLDHLFHSKHFTIQSILRLPHIGSDHFPLLTRLIYSPESGVQQTGLEADKDDIVRANEIVKKKGVDESKVPDMNPN